MSTEPTLTELFEYLDRLRESGRTNMFGAAPYLQEEKGVSDIHRAREVVSRWMDSFDPDLTPAERAAKVEARNG